MIVYIYINEKEKHDAIKLSEEEKIIEDVAKKNPFVKYDNKDEE
jgi:hypothetical protein